MGTSSMVQTAAVNCALTIGRTDASADRSSGPLSEDNLVEDLRVTSAIAEIPIDVIGTRNSSTSPVTSWPSSHPKAVMSSKPTLSFKQVVQLASIKSKYSDDRTQQQSLNAKMDQVLKSQERMAKLQKQVLEHEEEAKRWRTLSDAKQEEMKQLALAHHEEIKQLQIQALGQLSVLQSRVQAVLTQTYELHDYPIPRLFVVLPQDPSRWYAADPFSNKFRLYFLCECGEHTKSIDSNTEIHFAKHEGYELARPTEFFQLYGSHVFTILKMLKFGISVAGVAVPATSHLVRADAIDQATTYLKILKDFEPMVDPVLDWMDKVSTNEGKPVEDFDKQMNNKEALAGTDLRRLNTFLKAKDGDKVLGNLYRTVMDEGHVKWVCIDHYHENYQESTAKDFQHTLDVVGGSFDKNLGQVEVTLRSKVLAEQFFSALGKARSVYELDIVFDWACTMSDLEHLEVALKKSTRVSVFRLEVRRFQTGKLLSTSQYGVLLRFAEIPSMKTIHFVLPIEYIKCLNIQPKAVSHPCKLSFNLATGRIGKNEFGRLAMILKGNLTLIALDFRDNKIGDDGAGALAEALKTNSTLTTLNLQDNKIGNDRAKALAEALKTNKILTTLNLQSNSIGSDGAKALAEALKTNSTLTTLNLKDNQIGFEGALVLILAQNTSSTLITLVLEESNIRASTVVALSDAFKTNSTLVTLDLRGNSMGDNGAQALAEALKTNSTVTTLNLERNNIESDGAKALAEALKTNKTLTTLNLEDNKIGSDGAMALAETLKTNSTVTTLNLESSDIGEDGAKALAEALKTNSTLATLDLWGNSMGDYGAQALAEALKANSTMTTLTLGSNFIGSDGAMALAEALKTNSTMTTLNLGYNISIGYDGAKALAEELKTNSTVIIIRH